MPRLWLRDNRREQCGLSVSLTRRQVGSKRDSYLETGRIAFLRMKEIQRPDSVEFHLHPDWPVISASAIGGSNGWLWRLSSGAC
jgi:hypothetical protein